MTTRVLSAQEYHRAAVAEAERRGLHGRSRERFIESAAVKAADRDAAARQREQLAALGRLVICQQLGRPVGTEDMRVVADMAGSDITMFVREREERQGNMRRQASVGIGVRWEDDPEHSLEYMAAILDSRKTSDECAAVLAKVRAEYAERKKREAEQAARGAPQQQFWLSPEQLAQARTSNSPTMRQIAQSQDIIEGARAWRDEPHDQVAGEGAMAPSIVPPNGAPVQSSRMMPGHKTWEQWHADADELGMAADEPAPEPAPEPEAPFYSELGMEPEDAEAAALDTDDAEPAAPDTACPGCSTVNNPTAKYCQGCGGMLAASEPEEADNG